MAAAASGSVNAVVQEFTIRVPKTANKRFHVMKFSSDREVDFKKWSNVKMERENNLKEYRGMDEEQPKFGAGSEFGREQREEARRKKFGIVTRRYRPDDQPWLLKVGGKGGKKFKGIRDGGVGENAAYYVFMHGADGAIEAYPLNEWYNFQPIQRFKALSAEEAEEAYGKRNKTLNYFNLMLRKRLRPDAEDVREEGEEKGKKGGAKKDLTISEMDEWMNSSDDSDGSEKDEKDSADEDKKKQKKKGDKKKKSKKASDDEAVEESDDGDEEGREHEYISDSSASDSEIEEKGVAEEDALRKLLTSDEDSEDEEKKDDGDEDEADKEEQQAEDKKKKKKPKAKEAAKKGKAKRKDDMGALIAGSSSELSSDSSDAETKPVIKKEGSRSSTPTVVEAGTKRKADAPTTSSPPVKKVRSEGSGEMEEAVRRYLTRKPMTTTELLQKFKSKRTGMSSQQLVELMTQILKRINPLKQTIKGKMYLSIKATPNK